MKSRIFILSAVTILILNACSYETVPNKVLPSVNSQKTTKAPEIEVQQKMLIASDSKDFTYSFKKIETLPVVEANPSDLDDILKALLPKEQKMVIDNGKDTLIMGEAGTVIAIAANSLVHNNGKEVKGPVNLQLTEYTRPSQFAAMNLITRTTDGDLLETVGMLNIVATQKGDTLKLADGEEFAVAFPLKSTKSNFDVWDAKTNSQGLVEWALQKNSTQAFSAEKENRVPVHMHPLLSDQKNQFVMLQTCSGSGWQTYFNNRFRFPEGEGEELKDEKNFLSYSFKVNKSGRVVDLFVDVKGLPEHIVQLSQKYEWLVQGFLSTYPKLNLCRLPDYKKQTYRFVIKPGNTTNHEDLISLSEQEGGYTANELSELYTKTGEEVYLSAYLQKIGTKSEGKIPQTKAKRSSKILNAFLKSTGEIGRTVLSVTSLGLINGDCVASMGSNIKYKSGAAIKAIVTGAGSTIYMIFKNMGSFIKGSGSSAVGFTFGDRIPKGEAVTLVAVSERNGQRFMSQNDLQTANLNLQINPDVPFNLEVFKEWLDNP